MSKSKKKRWRTSNVFIALLAIIGYYILLWPTSLDLLNNVYNQTNILAYNSTMVSYSDEEIQEMFEKMEEYNEGIYETSKTTTYHYQGPTATDKTYTSLPTSGSDIGYLRIPDINVNVTVAHGTSDATLQGTAGHLYGTSLPIAGENVHAVIAAHSALSSAKLFTDLNKLKKGQKFYVTVLNQEYEYEIDQIKTVLPTDDYKYEQVEEGGNYVTLYTCTPYGVNTHRLLVRGKLVGQKTVETSDEGLNWNDILNILKPASLFGLVVVGPLMAILGYALYRKHERKKSKKLGKPTKTSRSAEVKADELIEREGIATDEIIQEKKE